MEQRPDPNVSHPIPGFPVTYIKPTLTRPNILVGEYSYCSGEDFESQVTPYTIVVGNPAKPVRRRFDEELIALLQAFQWWDRPVDEIQAIIPLLTDHDVEHVKRELARRLP